ncbi:allergin-1-like isoform X1 [Mobula birostris]|uniref:allergin-1-like isoform X1 n=1 Tax=Mobula birostris TaxID=1983395 RepID=UPI003B27B48E
MLKPVILVLVQLLLCHASAPGVKTLPVLPVTESAVPRTQMETVPATARTESAGNSTALGSSPASMYHDNISKPEIKSVTSKTTLEVGNCISLQCYSTNGTLPVTYSLFLRTRHISTIKKFDRDPAIFNVLINNTEDGGVYKCKATSEVSDRFKYSEGIHFTIKGTTSYKWLYYTTISLLLLVGTLVIICIKVGKNRINKRYKTQEQRNQDTNVDNTCSIEDKVVYTQLNLRSQKNKKAQQQEGVVYTTINFNE